MHMPAVLKQEKSRGEMNPAAGKNRAYLIVAVFGTPLPGRNFW